MPGSSSPWRLNFVRWSLTFVSFSLEPSSCHLLAVRVLRWLVGCLENLCTPALWQHHCNSSRNSPLPLAHRICLILFLFTLRYLLQTRVVWKDFNIRIGEVLYIVYPKGRHVYVVWRSSLGLLKPGCAVEGKPGCAVEGKPGFAVEGKPTNNLTLVTTKTGNRRSDGKKKCF
jgi:hypothetical protein